MYALASMHQNAPARVEPRLTLRRAFKQAKVIGAAAGLVGGVLAPLLGSALTAASWIVADEGARQWFSTTGTALLCLTIPLLIFGGYCMDWAEKDKPQRDSKVVRYEDDDDQ